MPALPPRRVNPVSPNIQIYRPQLTSVLSIANRMTGIALGVFAVGIVVWLAATASGSATYAIARDVVASWPGQLVLFGGTFAFFLHLLGGIRHLVWDMGFGFELRTIYRSGWFVVIASVGLTLMTWALSWLLAG